MALQLFVDTTGWDAARQSVRHTAATLAASDEHAGAAKPIKQLLTRWNALDTERRDAEDALVDTNALVRWIDIRVLDPAVQELASLLLHEAQQNRANPTFKKYFPEPPNDVIRLGLESEIERVKAFFHVAEEVLPSKEVKAVLAKISAASKRGTVALKSREEAVTALSRVSLKIMTWKEDANGARRAVVTLLDDYANKGSLPRDYSDVFFPAAVRPKKKVAKPVPAPAGS